MKNTALKTVLLCALALCGGFAVIGYFEGDSSWWIWALVFIPVLIAYSLLCSKSRPQKKEPVASVLDEEKRKQMEAGIVEPMESDVALKNGEKLLWKDYMRLDYYESTPHLFYLTDNRLFCLDEDFSFSHPLKSIVFHKGNNGISLEIGKKKYSFVTPSQKAFENALAAAGKEIS